MPALTSNRNNFSGYGAIICLLSCLATLALLVTLSWHSDLALPGVPYRYFFFLTLAGLSYLVAVLSFEHVPELLRPKLFWGMAIGVKVAVLGMAPGDDIWRYLWEGYIQHFGANPYMASPDSPALAELRTDWWVNVNHAQWAAIYPPGAQLCFRLLTQFGVSITLFKVVFLLLDLATVYLLLRMHVGKSRHRDAAWYAWCPLVAAMLVGAAHFDGIMIFLMTVALWALHRANPMDQQPATLSWLVICGIALGAAISVKVIPALLIPLIFFHLRWRFMALLPGLFIPLLLAVLYGFPEVNIFRSLADFAHVARTNELLWWAIDYVIPNPEQKNWNYNVIIGIWAVLCGLAMRNNWRNGALWVIGGYLILSPLLHAWYLTWVLPLAAWQKARAWFILSVTVGVYFLLYQKTLFEEAWLMEAEWRVWLLGPPLLWLVAHYYGKWITQRAAKS